MNQKNGIRKASAILAAGIALIAAISFFFSFNVVFSNASTPSANVVASATVNSICSLSISNTAINFGQITPTSSVATSNAVALIDTGGNAPANILTAGGNWISGSNSFYVANTLWNPTSAGAGVGNTLALFTGPASLVDTLIQVPAPTLSNSITSNLIYFGVGIPAGTPTGVYTQNIVIGNSCNTATYNTIATANVQSACFIGVSTSVIDFGAINPGSNVPTANQIIVQDPGGNIPANVYVDGGNWISGSNQFYVTNTLWDASSQGTYTGTALQLAPSGLTDTLIQLPAPTLTSPTSTNNIYFGLGIPNGAVAGAYTQNIIIENSC